MIWPLVKPINTWLRLKSVCRNQLLRKKQLVRKREAKRPKRIHHKQWPSPVWNNQNPSLMSSKQLKNRKSQARQTGSKNSWCWSSKNLTNQSQMSSNATLVMQRENDWAKPPSWNPGRIHLKSTEEGSKTMRLSLRVNWWRIWNSTRSWRLRLSKVAEASTNTSKKWLRLRIITTTIKRMSLLNWLRKIWATRIQTFPFGMKSKTKLRECAKLMMKTKKKSSSSNGNSSQSNKFLQTSLLRIGSASPQESCLRSSKIRCMITQSPWLCTGLKLQTCKSLFQSWTCPRENSSHQKKKYCMNLYTDL